MSDFAPEHPQLRVRPTTQPAEGLPRLKWTVAELDRMVEAGICNGSDRSELIGGELVPISPKGIRHESVKTRRLNWLMPRFPADQEIAIELGWRPDASTFLEPDLLAYPVGLAPSTVDSASSLLVIAAAHDCWVVNAVTLDTDIHRAPAEAGYGEATRHRPDQMLPPSPIPALAFRLGDLGIA